MSFFEHEETCICPSHIANILYICINHIPSFLINKLQSNIRLHKIGAETRLNTPLKVP